MLIQYCLFFILMIPGLTFTEITDNTRKLSSLFGRNYFFCPTIHKTTFIPDLCYLASKSKMNYSEGIDYCSSVSHRLAIIHNKDTNTAIRHFLNRISTQSDKRPISYFIDNKSIQDLIIDDCNRSVKESMKSNRCSELTIEMVGKSNSTKICFNSVDCGKSRIVICEWRGDNIANFSVELKSQILVAYLSSFSALLLFSIIWLVLYQCQAKRVNEEISYALKSFTKELDILTIDVKKFIPNKPHQT